MKKKYIYIISIMVPVLIFFLMSTISKYIPFFDEIYQVFDARHQYPGFYIELMNRLKEGNFFYSFNGGLGFNFLGTLTYYLMSPLNLLMIFFSAASLSYFFLITILIRIGLSGLTMAIYLNNQKNSKPIWTITFSTVFALMGFLSGYYYNFMWIDSIIMLPLILLGIDKLIEKKKIKFYIISLTLGIIFNYYIGIMLCIFSVIYFIYKIMSVDNIKYLEVIKRFILSSLLCGMLSAFVLIPTYFALTVGKAKIYGTDWINYFEINHNATAFFYKLTPGSYNLNDQSYGPAMVYSSLFAIALVCLSFFNSKFTLKEKITTALILLFFYLSFSFNLLDYAWQLFQKPIWWQSRYSFTFSTFVIVVAAKNMLNIDGLKVKGIERLIVIAVFSLLILVSGFFTLNATGSENYDASSYFFLGFSILIFAQMVYLLGDEKINWYLIILVFLELSLNTYNGLEKTYFNNSISSIKKEVETYQKPVDYIKDMDKDFYRMEFMQLNTTNDGMLFNYHGVNFFNSTRNQKTMDFLEYKACIDVDSGCGVKMKSFNPALMSLFNVKYLIGEIDYYPKIYENGNKSIYQIKNPLGLGFMVNEKTLRIPVFNNTFNQNMNNIYSAFLDEDINFIKYTSKSEINYKYDNIRIDDSDVSNAFYKKNSGMHASVTMEYTSKGNYLLYPEDLFKKSNSIFINEKVYSKNKGGFIYLREGDTLRVIIEIKDSPISEEDFYFYLFDLDLYEYSVNELDLIMEINNNSKHLIEGKVTATKNRSLLFTTIPYEEGMVVKVDGKVVTPSKVFDTFVGIELSVGEHLITIDYFPQGLKEGLSISGLGIVIGGCYYFYKKKVVK